MDKSALTRKKKLISLLAKKNRVEYLQLLEVFADQLRRKQFVLEQLCVIDDHIHQLNDELLEYRLKGILPDVLDDQSFTLVSELYEQRTIWERELLKTDKQIKESQDEIFSNEAEKKAFFDIDEDIHSLLARIQINRELNVVVEQAVIAHAEGRVL